METLRTSEIGKRLKEEWPDAFTQFTVRVDSHCGCPPEVRLSVYHAGAWCSGRTLEECIEKVKAVLAPKPPSPGDTEVVIDTEVPDGSDRSPTSRS